MRPLALCYFRRMVRFRDLERGAVVDRRQPAPEQHFALEIEFLRGLVAAVYPSRRGEAGELPLVILEALRLPLLAIGLEAQPSQIGADRRDKLVAAALAVGIVDPQQEAAAVLPREQPVVQRRANVADVEAPRRRRRETGDDGGAGFHAARLGRAA